MTIDDESIAVGGQPGWAGRDLTPLPYESEISCLMRFAWRNAINRAAFLRHFSLSKAHIVLDRQEFLEQTGWNLIGDGRSEVERELQWTQTDWVTRVFRHCPLCLEAGYHSFLFQCLQLQCCPLHHVELSSRCMWCSGTSPQIGGKELLAAPYRCMVCGRPLAGVMPNLDEHLALRAIESGLVRALEPYAEWSNNIHEIAIPRVQGLRRNGCSGDQSTWCDIGEFLRGVACRGMQPPLMCADRATTNVSS